MKNVKKCDYPNIALINYFFEYTTQLKINLYKELFGWCDYVYKIEFQQRGAPHIHAIQWIPNSYDLFKIYSEDITKTELSIQLDKIHIVSNRFTNRLNEVTKYDQENMAKLNNDWTKIFITKRNSILEKLCDIKNPCLLQMIKKMYIQYQNNDYNIRDTLDNFIR